MKRLIAVLAALTLCVVLFPTTASAASGTAAVSVSPASVDPGANFTVTVKVSGTALCAIEGYVEYDSSKIEFVSGSGANGTGGSVKLSAYDQNGTGAASLSCSMTFTAKAAGSAAITFRPTEVVDANFQPVEVANASTSVTVKAPPTLSGNADLASLKPSTGTLSPAFSANTTSYTMTVHNAVDHVYLSAKAQDSGAKVADSGSGTQTLAVGTTTRVITVTAPNGNTKKYTVKITRQPAEGETVSQTPASSESETLPVRRDVTVSVNGKTMTVVEDLTDVELPAGFTADVLIINNDSVVCVRNAAGIPLLYLIDDESAGFYVYDSETISFTPLDTISVGGATYLILEKPRNTALPAGFSAAKVAIGERTLSGWQSKTEKGFFLLYLCGPGTYKGFYRYDSAEGTLQRYVTASDTAADAPVKEPSETLEGPAAFAAEYWLPLAAGAGAIILGLTSALILVAALKGRSKKAATPDAADPEEEDDDVGADFDLSTFTKTKDDRSEE